MANRRILSRKNTLEEKYANVKKLNTPPHNEARYVPYDRFLRLIFDERRWTRPSRHSEASNDEKATTAKPPNSGTAMLLSFRYTFEVVPNSPLDATTDKVCEA